MATTTKILVIGGTGYMGKFIVEASIKAGYPTFALVRESTLSNQHKSSIIHNFNILGVNIVLGDINDQHCLVKVMKQVDVVISTVSHTQLSHQYKILAAIKEAGNIKRFFPSEFGNDVDQNHGVDEGKVVFDTKVKFRRDIEAEGIPHTYVVANFLTQHFFPTWSQLMDIAPPLDTVLVLGDGNIKSIFNTEEGVAAFTIRTVDDPRTLNKTLYIRPPSNTLSYNDLISLWEKKTGNTLKRIYIREEQILKMMQESPYPLIKMGFAICLAAFVKGDHTNYEIDPSIGVEASKLYPDVKYITLDDYFEENHDRTPFYINWLISINK
ncbi:phenylcoumaran benzylic ether reductase Betv6 [Trifolium repens]|nr:phenylcoumaran benzylic ether reductase Betv6 [Trifolium repens]